MHRMVSELTDWTDQTCPRIITHMDAEWDVNSALDRLTMERAFGELDTPQALAKKLFEENLPLATMAICHLATRSETEMIRFNAAKYVVERTMGPADRPDKIEGKHVWDEIYEEVLDNLNEQAEGYANSSLEEPG